MTLGSRKEYIEIMRTRYQDADRKERSTLLDEVCCTSSYTRKYAISLLSQTRSRKSKSRSPSGRSRGRPRRYDDPRILEFLKQLWKAGNLPCGKRLKAMIPLWLPWYVQKDGRPLPEHIIALLMEISAASIDRLLKPLRSKHGKLGLATTKPGSILRTQIPIQRSVWREDRPGFFEVDTVAHCGTSMKGSVAYTMNLVDIATGWTEQWALWGRGQHGIVTGLHSIEHDLPFPLLGLDSDSGSEFINWQVYNYLHKRRMPVRFTRGRPDHANDNAHVEQKNWCVVREYLGYDRFDNPGVVARMQALYRGPLRLFLNFFLPSMKQIEKQRIAEKIKRKHDTPITPYQRVLRSSHISARTKKKLTAQFQQLNPFTLTMEIAQGVADILTHCRCGDPDCPYHP
jgi:hypothetical protein